MTAINPAKLKIQCLKLAESFLDPEGFTSRLHELLTFYTARVRQSKLTHTSEKLQAYQVPPPVLRGLELELIEETHQFPEETLTLLDLLWKEDWLEFKQLAVILLGSISTTYTEEILNRIQNWARTPTEDLRQQIMTRGLQRLRVEEKYRVLDLIKKLGASADKKDRQEALFGLMPFAVDTKFDDLPKIFKVLGDILMIEETIFVKEITGLLRSLKMRSEQETAYFLVRQLAKASKPRILRITRQIMREFSEDHRVLMRDGLSNYS